MEFRLLILMILAAAGMASGAPFGAAKKFTVRDQTFELIASTNEVVVHPLYNVPPLDAAFSAFEVQRRNSPNVNAVVSGRFDTNVTVLPGGLCIVPWLSGIKSEFLEGLPERTSTIQQIR